MRKSVESCKSKKSSLFDVSRRNFLTGASSLVATTAMSGCAANFGSSSSYLTNIVAEDKLSVVFEWTDIAPSSFKRSIGRAATSITCPYNGTRRWLSGRKWYRASL